MVTNGELEVGVPRTVPADAPPLLAISIESSALPPGRTASRSLGE